MSVLRQSADAAHDQRSRGAHVYPRHRVTVILPGVLFFFNLDTKRCCQRAFSDLNFVLT